MNAHGVPVDRTLLTEIQKPLEEQRIGQKKDLVKQGAEVGNNRQGHILAHADVCDCRCARGDVNAHGQTVDDQGAPPVDIENGLQAEIDGVDFLAGLISGGQAESKAASLPRAGQHRRQIGGGPRANEFR